VLDKGRIVQEGTHRTLLAEPWLEAHLWPGQPAASIQVSAPIRCASPCVILLKRMNRNLDQKGIPATHINNEML